MRESNEINMLELIREVFANRPMPDVLVSSKQLSEDERKEVMSFQGKHWSAVTCEQLELCHEVVFWFSAKAFCYYLPGILSAGIKENRPDLLVYHSIIEMLDRSLDPTHWDDFFLERWPLLTPKECEAVQEWVLWLASLDSTAYYDNTFSRALETLDLLKHGVTAIKSKRTAQ